MTDYDLKLSKSELTQNRDTEIKKFNISFFPFRKSMGTMGSSEIIQIQYFHAFLNRVIGTGIGHHVSS